ncbi:MAG: hypothetical protein ACR2RF_24980 [Geminicoccaceae bacterium]
MAEFEPVEIEISRSPRRVTQMGVRRIVDARLFDSLGYRHEDAAQAIHDGFRAITEGLHYKPAAFERLDRSPGTVVRVRDYLTDCTRHFWRWGQEMQCYRLPTAPILDVFVFGFSCREVDRDRRKRNGWTKSIIDEGLGLYCKERGWT